MKDTKNGLQDPDWWRLSTKRFSIQLDSHREQLAPGNKSLSSSVASPV